MKITIGIIFVLLFSSFAVRGAQAQETAGKTLAKLDSLSPRERTKVLIREAKAEGELTIYSSMRQRFTSIGHSLRRDSPRLPRSVGWWRERASNNAFRVW